MAVKLPPKAPESDFVDHDDAEDLKDRGDDTPDDEEEEEEEEKPAKKAAKKPAKKGKADDESEEEEEADESEEEEEADESEEEDEEEGKKKPDKRVVDRPRYDRMKRSRDKAQEEADELRRKLQEQEESKSDTAKKKMEDLQTRLDGLYEKVEDLRADGKPKEAARVQREIDDLRGKMTASQATYYATAEAMKQADVRVYNGMVRELEVIDPRFDSKSDDYDEDLVEEVDELTQAYEAKGMATPDAFRKACKNLLREDVFAPGKSLKREDKKKPEPKKTDLKKNVDANRKQPPEDPGAVKDRGGKINFATLTEKEFDALPETTKAKYRGDFDD